MTFSINRFRTEAQDGGLLKVTQDGQNQAQKLKAENTFWGMIVIWIKSLFKSGKDANQEVMDHFFDALRQEYGQEMGDMQAQHMDGQYQSGSPLQSRKVMNVIDQLDARRRRILETNNELATFFAFDFKFEQIFEKVAKEVGVYSKNLADGNHEAGKNLRHRIETEIKNRGLKTHRSISAPEAEDIIKDMISKATDERVTSGEMLTGYNGRIKYTKISSQFFDD